MSTLCSKHIYFRHRVLLNRCGRTFIPADPSFWLKKALRRTRKGKVIS